MKKLLQKPDRVLLLILTGFGLALGVVGWSYYRLRENALLAATGEELRAIAELKVAHIFRWREEALDDANLLLESSLVQNLAKQSLDDPGAPETHKQLLDWMTAFEHHSHTKRVVLLDSTLKVCLATPEDQDWVGPVGRRFAAAALQAHRLVISDLNISPTSGLVNMAYLVPVLTPAAASGQPTARGVFFLEVDPNEFLFPRLQFWPTSSRTAETLLVRREGDDVLYLNPLRHRADAALKLRLPLAKSADLPAGQAVLGREGLTRGLDYRGELVLAALRQVPDSPWFIVAKEDLAEIRAPLRSEMWGIVTVAGAIMLAVGFGVRLVWSNRERECSTKELEAHRQIEEALRQNEERFRSFTAATFEGICVAEQGRILDVSDRYAAMFGYSREELLGREILSMVAPESRAVVAEAVRSEREAAYEHQALRKDGSIFTAEVQARMSMWKGRRTRFSAVRDITERKRAEEELRKAHAELVETSRVAGIAEVATSVLHNVGNVLNSVNVSTSLVADQIKQSRAANIARVAALMREHAGDLGEFITSDPKGKQLPRYLEQLAEHLGQEQESLLKELQGLKANVEHIKDIITMQQSYAKAGGASQTVEVTELVEDALRMNADSIDRSGVRVIREYPPQVPRVTLHKYKALQILVNLIRNARHALAESKSAEKHLTMSVKNSEDSVKISVTDDGVGIPAETLPRLFTRGFTTRKDGHGFGLHSSLAAAKEMGGQLQAQSDGPGKGATFTLELPLGRKPSQPTNDSARAS